MSYAASFPLARQIDAGAPVISSSAPTRRAPTILPAGRVVKAGTRKDFLTNDLVLIAPRRSRTRSRSPSPGFTGALKGGRLAMGDPASVPAGKYAQAALTNLGLWDAVKNHLALADNVRSALLYVSRGETPMGIVYATDAFAAPQTAIVATFPGSSHPPIRYPIAETATANPATDAFLHWLTGPEAAPFFRTQGFGVLTVQ